MMQGRPVLSNGDRMYLGFIRTEITVVAHPNDLQVLFMVPRIVLCVLNFCQVQMFAHCFQCCSPSDDILT